ncbi:MAG: N-acetylmuramic acid 6-phosphate etherase [Sphaerochaeta sp.]
MNEKIDLRGMTTETTNSESAKLDRMTSLEIVTLMNREDAKVPEAISVHLPEIAKAISWSIESFNQGGRLFYIGAGTSGRLGVVDASECPPTFGVSDTMVVGLIAGGEKAFIKAVEGAEDSLELGREDLIAHDLNSKDVVIGIAASGRTPYVIGGLKYARSLGCHTVSLSCNTGSEIGKCAELAIEVVVGPEILTGSTRLKSGTCQKLVLNMISTASMVGIGKCYNNLMVDVMQSNEKLKVRAQNILIDVAGITRQEASEVLERAGGSVKKAIVMVLASCSAEQAEERLVAAKGHVRKAYLG